MYIFSKNPGSIPGGHRTPFEVASGKASGVRLSKHAELLAEVTPYE